MVLAIDVYYTYSNAKVCGFLFNWQDASPLKVVEEIVYGIGEYIPGKFYKRELPCILNLLDKISYKEVEAIVIDGYVFVDNNYTKGLGGMLFDKLNDKIPVIGVAKNKFLANTETTVPIFRGQSQKPLYVSAIGIDKEEAANKIIGMPGIYRIPTILKALDILTRQ